MVLGAAVICKSIPLGGLAIGKSWQHALLYVDLASPSLAVSLHLCHQQREVRGSSSAMSSWRRGSICDYNTVLGRSGQAASASSMPSWMKASVIPGACKTLGTSNDSA